MWEGGSKGGKGRKGGREKEEGVGEGIKRKGRKGGGKGERSHGGRRGRDIVLYL